MPSKTLNIYKGTKLWICPHVTIIMATKDPKASEGFNTVRTGFRAERSGCAGGHGFIMERYDSAFDLIPYSFPL